VALAAADGATAGNAGGRGGGGGGRARPVDDPYPDPDSEDPDRAVYISTLCRASPLAPFLQLKLEPTVSSLETTRRIHGGYGESLVPPYTRGSVSLFLSPSLDVSDVIPPRRSSRREEGAGMRPWPRYASPCCAASTTSATCRQGGNYMVTCPDRFVVVWSPNQTQV